ncbi:MAG TPA: pentapeptide repeat-containing protein [Pseudonocardia sp.]|jgi:uncharacterized protein YjbI with pentapeptide repeats
MSPDPAVVEGLDLTGARLADDAGPLARTASGRPPTLRRCTLAEADLTGLDLSGVLFEHCVLDRATLRDCVLDRARFRGGSAVGARFSEAELTDAELIDLDLSGARFDHALLADTRFTGCRMLGAALTPLRGLAVTFVLDRCNLQLADLSDTALRGLRVTGSDLSEADLRGADLREAVFVDCRLRNTDLGHTRLTGADLRGADLGLLTEDSPRQLRGATISAAQAAEICTVLGLTVA